MPQRDPDTPLAESFLAAVHSDVARTGQIVQLEVALSTSLAQAREAYPAFDVPDQAFAAHVARHCTDADAIATSATTDLYLALACARRDEAALEVLHRVLLPQLQHSLSRLGITGDELDDARLQIMQRLVVDDPPQIERYAGRGSLAQWLSAVAARQAISDKRTAARRRGLLDAAAEGLVDEDPELGFIKAHYRAKFREAFATAMDRLESADRSVLRHRFLDGLTLDQLAAVLGVHRATAARHLARIRSELLEATRAALGADLGIGADEVDSVVRLIASNFEVSVRGLLRRSVS